jgi:hypothetical protein
MRDYEEMLERDRRGNPPEVRTKDRESRARFKAMLAEIKQNQVGPTASTMQSRKRDRTKARKGFRELRA